MEWNVKHFLQLKGLKSNNSGILKLDSVINLLRMNEEVVIPIITMNNKALIYLILTYLFNPVNLTHLNLSQDTPH